MKGRTSIWFLCGRAGKGKMNSGVKPSVQTWHQRWDRGSRRNVWRRNAGRAAEVLVRKRALKPPSSSLHMWNHFECPKLSGPCRSSLWGSCSVALGKLPLRLLCHSIVLPFVQSAISSTFTLSPSSYGGSNSLSKVFWHLPQILAASGSV